MSTYEGLSSKLEKRFSSGMTFLTTFTYGHAIDLQNPALDLCDGCGSGDTLQDNYNRWANHSSSDNDIRFRYVFAGSYELPFGKGKRWLGQGGPGTAILGGWRLTAIYQQQTGLPFTPGLSFDSANAGTTSRPNRVCDGNISGGGTLQRYFDTSCFVTAPSYTFGNAGRNILRAPGIHSLDASIQRDFRMPIEHPTIIQFRAEGFNAMNHGQFGTPGGTVGSATYGVINSTSVDNRQFQLGLRVTF